MSQITITIIVAVPAGKLTRWVILVIVVSILVRDQGTIDTIEQVLERNHLLVNHVSTLVHEYVI